MKARLCLEDGLILVGTSFGSRETAAAEVVFNTSILGYQEVLTDTSYHGQIVTMSAPQIGNVGVNPMDREAPEPRVSGFCVRELSPVVASYRGDESLSAYLDSAKIAGIEDVDTRKLVRHLRDHGSQRGVISSESVSDAALLELARAVPPMEGSDLATPVSTVAPYSFGEGTYDVALGKRRETAPQRHVVAVDYGLKRSMLELLVDQGCRITVVPCTWSASRILALAPDGVLLSNGPGDPAAVVGATETVAALLGRVPIFGICLGHQILALAAGAKTYKMPFGHRGANHPVIEHATGQVTITCQNHGFAVDGGTVGKRAIVTHASLNDRVVEGLSLPDAKAFSVQYHPEGAPGPHDARGLFRRFVELIEGSASGR